MKNFDERLNVFLTGARKMLEEHLSKFAHLPEDDLLVVQGRRYVKVVRAVRRTGAGLSVYCFIDKMNGDVLKPATWRAPAKHARGNIFNEDAGLSALTPYGVKYL